MVSLSFSDKINLEGQQDLEDRYCSRHSLVTVLACWFELGKVSWFDRVWAMFVEKIQRPP